MLHGVDHYEHSGAGDGSGKTRPRTGLVDARLCDATGFALPWHAIERMVLLRD